MELNFQYAHHSHDESESKPITKPEDALVAFDEFNWGGEVEKANELQKCSPTITLLFNSKEHMIWVSGCGDKNNLNFVSECSFPGEVSGFLGFGKKQGIINLGTGAFSLKQAREAISLFISNSHEELRALYKNA